MHKAFRLVVPFEVSLCGFFFIGPPDAGRAHPRPWLPRINSGAKSRLPECRMRSGWWCRSREV